jgi:hypothetical protein
MSAACENYKAITESARGPGTAMTVGSTTIPANVTDTLNAKANGTRPLSMAKPASF